MTYADASQISELLNDVSARCLEFIIGACEQTRMGQASVSACLSQFQELQHYLCSYSTWNVPVVDNRLSESAVAVDQLHDYLLQCIRVAMTSDGQLPD